jgi:ribosome-binding protein aMBF1 (putative translation factor)
MVMSISTDDYSNNSFGPGLDELTAEFTDTPEKAEAYERDLRVMIIIRRLLMAIDQERERRSLTKADLATMIGVNPASIRRLFTSENANPTLRTVLMLMAALRIDLDLRVQAAEVNVENMQEAEPGQGETFHHRSHGKGAAA